MTKQLAMAADGMTIVLPGAWTRIPLENPEHTVAFVKRFVKRQTGRADRLAKVRRETVQDLVASARDAVQIGVHTYLMSLEILPRVPFPAALLFLDQEWTEESRTALADGDVEAALTAAFGAVEMGDSRNGPFGRRWEVQTQSIGEEELLTLRLEYFVPYPDRSGVLVARANVPNIPRAEPFGLLFNEIIDSISFPEPAAPVETADAPTEQKAAATRG